MVSRDEALKNLPVDEELEEGPLAGPPLQCRRDARELALKILYSQELSRENWNNIFRQFFPEGEDNTKYSQFAKALCEKVEEGSERIDNLIRTHSEKWEFNRIAIIDKLILRIAIAEILFFPDIPPKVTINEAIEIAKQYSTANSSRFVNGILDAIFNELGEKLNKIVPEKEKKPNSR
jgi:N utilization substance protein B